MIRYEDISAAIHVRHLQVEIAEALTFERADRAELAADALAARGVHLLHLAGAIAEVRARLGAPSPGHWHRLTSGLVGLRNAVMHPTRDLVGRERSLARLVELDTLLRDLLRRLEGAETWDLTART